MFLLYSRKKEASKRLRFFSRLPFRGLEPEFRPVQGTAVNHPRVPDFAPVQRGFQLPGHGRYVLPKSHQHAVGNEGFPLRPVLQKAQKVRLARAQEGV